ncbi:MAG: hypothetical protein JRC77_04910 [Deltaproteobacteria bacterium]|nr:hypothetical protein [Deltaproteobacteria bacterium]
MSTSPFEAACDHLEKVSELSRADIQETLKGVLRKAGFSASAIKPPQMAAVLRMLAPAELSQKGVENATEVCGKIAHEILQLKAQASGNSPESVFKRFGGDSE